MNVIRDLASGATGIIGVAMARQFAEDPVLWTIGVIVGLLEALNLGIALYQKLKNKKD